MIKNASKQQIKMPQVAMPDINMIVKDVTSYLTMSQQEQTKRAEIMAKRDAVIASIQSQRDIIMHALDHTFQERAMVIQGQLDALENAVKGNNIDMVGLCLQGMAHVIQTSPFQNIAGLKTLLSSSDSVLKLE